MLSSTKQDPQQTMATSEKFCGYVKAVMQLLEQPNFEYWKTNNPNDLIKEVLSQCKIRFTLLYPVCFL